MTREEILEAIKDLAKSQGYYGRLLRAIEEDETILDTLEEQNFNDVVDMVIYLESWGLKMFYYPTVDDYETVVSTVKYTLQSLSYRGSFTFDIISTCKGAILFNTDVLNTIDDDDIKKINNTSKDLRMVLEGDILVVDFIDESGKVLHTEDLEEDSPDNESIIVGIEVVGAKLYEWKH